MTKPTSKLEHHELCPFTDPHDSEGCLGCETIWNVKDAIVRRVLTLPSRLIANGFEETDGVLELLDSKSVVQAVKDV